MEFKAVTLHMPAFGFDRDSGSPPAAPNPKTFRVNEHGCRRITGTETGVLVEGILVEKPRAFWTPYANVVWAEPVAADVHPSPQPKPAVTPPAPPPTSAAKQDAPANVAAQVAPAPKRK